jgi:hypothetical protein
MNVGRSWRTWAKHGLMSGIAGQEVGVANTARQSVIERLVFFDLTAGDGAAEDGLQWEKQCSPGILAKHAANSGKPVLVLLHEIQPNTYDRLLDSLADEWHLPLLGYSKDGEDCWRIGDTVVIKAFNYGGHRAAVDFLDRGDAVMVFNDPNAITEWAMRDTFAEEIDAQGVWCCRIFSTMGCNPSGLKRLHTDERLGWFALIDTQERACPGYRDLLLSAIERDASQWAYLLSTPQNWRESTEGFIEQEFRRVGRTAAMAWWRTDMPKFEATKMRLFLTDMERNLIQGDEAYWLSLDADNRLLFLIDRAKTYGAKLNLSDGALLLAEERAA